MNDYTTFHQGSAFTKVFRVKDYDLHNYATPKATWTFTTVKTDGITRKSLDTDRVSQKGKDVDITFEIPSDFFTADMVGSCKYQVSLYDESDRTPRLHTTEYIGEIKAPL